MIVLNLTGRTANQLLEISFADLKRKTSEKILVNIHEYAINSKTADGKEIDFSSKKLLNEEINGSIIEFDSALFYKFCKIISAIKNIFYSKFSIDHPHYRHDFFINILGLKLIFGYHQRKHSFDNLNNIIDASNLKIKPTTAVHIRLGDYLTDHHSNHNLNILKTISAILLKDNQVLNNGCSIYSDGNVNELVNQLKSSGIRCINRSTSTKSDIDAWWEMAQCERIYISNSSFSATAASIMSDKKTIFCPRKWMKTYDTPTDMLPTNHYYEI